MSVNITTASRICKPCGLVPITKLYGVISRSANILITLKTLLISPASKFTQAYVKFLIARN